MTSCENPCLMRHQKREDRTIKMTLFQTMKSNKNRTLPRVAAACLVFASFALFAFASPDSSVVAQDAVFKYRGDGRASRVSGRITAVAVDGVTIDGTKIPSAQIQKIA